jgi:hypothetical protein
MRQGSGFELTTYDSKSRAVQSVVFDAAVKLEEFLSQHTAYPLFFQENQVYRYERNGREIHFYRPYLEPVRDVTVRKRFYALAGTGVLIALVSLLHFMGPIQRRGRTGSGRLD